MAKLKKQYEIFHRIRIFDGEGHFVGKGRIELLELIQKHGSITRAAVEMKMSYRQAWQMVEDMNLLADEPLVEKMPGGKGGGGTRLTARGEKAIKIFHEIDEEINKLAKQLAKKIKF